MTNLTDLLGERMLDAVDFTCEKIHQYSDEYEDASVCRFRLDGVVYMAVEDPNDGYRSSLGSLIVPNDKTMGNVFPPVAVIGRMMADDEYEKHDVLEFVDAFTGKVVLEVGTANTNDYYPSFVASFHPEAMATNADKAAHEEAEKEKADGWIAWSGGECPVDASVLVEVRAEFGPDSEPVPAGMWSWDHDRPKRDRIIAYRVVAA